MRDYWSCCRLLQYLLNQDIPDFLVTRMVQYSLVFLELCFLTTNLWKGGRVVNCNGLENRDL